MNHTPKPILERAVTAGSIPLLVLLAMARFAAPAAAGQTPRPVVPDALTLGGAVAFALDHYPAIRVKMAEMAAAEASVNLAQTAYVPRVDTLLAVNRGTRNNVFGALFPQAVIPSISGPVLGSATSGTTFGSAAGVLVGWEPFDFGLRKANTDAAGAKRDEAAALLALARHQVALAVADAYLAVAANQQAARAATASLDRLRVVAESVHALADSGLRPGADESRVQVELALARTRSIQAEQRVQESLATLAEMLGAAGTGVRIDPGSLLANPPGAPPATGEGIDKHPLALASASAIRTSEARQTALDRSYVPKFTLQGALWARGTGAETNGTFLGGANGLAPSTANGAIGLTMTFPLSDIAAVRNKKAIERQTEAAEKARYDQTVQKLTGDLARARAERDGAEKIAHNTPSELQAAHTIVEQSQARYRAGLGTIVDVADAERLLTQAEIDDAVARLGVWRARLAETAAAGDVETAFK